MRSAKDVGRCASKLGRSPCDHWMLYAHASAMALTHHEACAPSAAPVSHDDCSRLPLLWGTSGRRALAHTDGRRAGHSEHLLLP
jgi:hypothetical protein